MPHNGARGRMVFRQLIGKVWQANRTRGAYIALPFGPDHIGQHMHPPIQILIIERSVNKGAKRILAVQNDIREAPHIQLLADTAGRRILLKAGQGGRVDARHQDESGNGEKQRPAQRHDNRQQPNTQAR